MSTFVITGLEDSQREKLAAAGIQFFDWDRSKQSVLIEEAQINSALEALGASATESDTNLGGVVGLSLHFRSPGVTDQNQASRFKVMVGRSWNGNNKEEIARIAREVLLPGFQQDIRIHVPHNRSRRPYDDGIFHILIWSTPETHERVTPPGEIFGIAVDCRDEAFTASGEGIPIVDEDTGYAVAEIVGDNLYIHHDIVEHGTERESRMFLLILQRVKFALGSTEEERSRHRQEEQERVRALSRAGYIKACGERMQAGVNEAALAVAESARQLPALENDFTRLCRTACFEELSMPEAELRQGFSEEFQRLLQVPRVRDVRVTARGVFLYTEMLYCTNPDSGRRHEIGEFLIIIEIDGGVRWINKTRRVDGVRPAMNAPRVYADGTGCVDESKETFCELIARCEFSVVADLAIQFVESFKDDQLDKYLDKWPCVSQEEEGHESST